MATATPKPTVTATPIATSTRIPTPTPEESVGELNNPIMDENGNVTYSCIYFGNYPQSDATGETKEPIKWRVLSIHENDAFLIADQNLDVMEYNKIGHNVTWETCTMRSWLNGYGSDSNLEGIDYSNDNFINKAFNDTEQTAILTTNVVNDANPEYGTSGGNNTQDKIFLSSIDEVSNADYGFLPYKDLSTGDTCDNARMRTNTAYVNNGGTIGSDYLKQNGATCVENKGSWWCWLRSPGKDNSYAMVVGDYGCVYENGTYVSNNREVVCPALHIDLPSSVWSMAENVTIER